MALAVQGLLHARQKEQSKFKDWSNQAPDRMTRRSAVDDLSDGLSVAGPHRGDRQRGQTMALASGRLLPALSLPQESSQLTAILRTNAAALAGAFQAGARFQRAGQRPPAHRGFVSSASVRRIQTARLGIGSTASIVVGTPATGRLATWTAPMRPERKP